jgi:signal peptidase II
VHHLQAVGGTALTTEEQTIRDMSDSSEDVAGRPARAPRKVWLALGSVATGVLLLDLVTKMLAVAKLRDGGSVRVLGGLFYLLLTRNSGAAFSIGTNYTFIFSIVAAVVSVGILWLVRQVASTPWAVCLGLILGGTVGNLVDRVFRTPGPFRGHVVDFISFLDPNGQGFPVFNIADSALTIGVILAVCLEVFGWRRDGGRVPLRSSSTLRE